MFWTPPSKNISGYGLVPTVLSEVVYPGIPKRKTSGESPPHTLNDCCVLYTNVMKIKIPTTYII